MKVKEIMTRSASGLHAGDAATGSRADDGQYATAARCRSVRRQGRGSIGIITDRDIVVRGVAEGRNPLTLTAAGDCMTTPRDHDQGGRQPRRVHRSDGGEENPSRGRRRRIRLARAASSRRPTSRGTRRARKPANSSATSRRRAASSGGWHRRWLAPSVPGTFSATTFSTKHLRDGALRAPASSGRPGVSPRGQMLMQLRVHLPRGRMVAGLGGRRAAPASALNRFGSLAIVFWNSASAAFGCFISSSISPSSSRAGASGPGVTAAFSVRSSRSAASRIAASASASFPSAQASHADAPSF